MASDLASTSRRNHTLNATEILVGDGDEIEARAPCKKIERRELLRRTAQLKREVRRQDEVAPDSTLIRKSELELRADNEIVDAPAEAELSELQCLYRERQVSTDRKAANERGARKDTEEAAAENKSPEQLGKRRVVDGTEHAKHDRHSEQPAQDFPETDQRGDALLFVRGGA